MVAQPNHIPMRVEEYFALDDASPEIRYEYIDGEVYALAGGSLDHSSIAVNLIAELKNRLRGKTCRVYNSDARVKISERRYVYPDISISCDQRDRGKKRTIEHPTVVIEVLSPSTASYDKGGKGMLYRSCPSLQEHVLISTDEELIEVYRRISPQRWEIKTYQHEEVVELKSVELQVPVEAIYEDSILIEEDIEE